MPPKRVAILQSNYVPWKGYFDIIHDVDECVLFEDVQYTPQNWRNRNRIKTSDGPVWLTIPVGDSKNRLLCEVELPQFRWADDQWDRIEAAYEEAPFFDRYRNVLSDALQDPKWRLLSDLNCHLIKLIAREILGITTEFRDSRSLHVEETGKQERVLEILHKTGAGVYVSGPAAQTFLDPKRFAEEGIELVWKDYSGYPAYEQLYPPFRHDVSILDLLFHAGPDAPYYIWGWRTNPR
jgi:hypothetical protein